MTDWPITWLDGGDGSSGLTPEQLAAIGKAFADGTLFPISMLDDFDNTMLWPPTEEPK